MDHPPAPLALTSWTRALGIGVALAALVTVVLLAFSWPAVTSTISRLPVAIVGSAEAVDAVTSAIDDAQPDVIQFTQVDDRASAIELIEQRETYGAIVVAGDLEVLTSSAASTLVSAMLGQVANGLQAQLGQAATAAGAPIPAVTLTDIVPLSDADPRGVGLAASAFPITFGGMIGGILISLLIAGPMRRLWAVVGYAAVAGFALTAVLQGWFGALQGDFILNAVATGVTILAISAPIVGMASLFGRAGIAFGPIVFLLFANPISSATSPVEALPGSWGAIGQLFPSGAGVTLLRDLSYFPNATSLAQAWMVVSIWALAGLFLIVAGQVRAAAAERQSGALQPQPLMG